MRAYSTLERAFQIAQSRTCGSIEELRTALTREGYADAVAQTGYPTVRRQLNQLMRGEAASAPAKPARRLRKLRAGAPKRRLI